jgi:hypothetical protein
MLDFGCAKDVDRARNEAIAPITKTKIIFFTVSHLLSLSIENSALIDFLATSVPARFRNHFRDGSALHVKNAETTPVEFAQMVKLWLSSNTEQHHLNGH